MDAAVRSVLDHTACDVVVTRGALSGIGVHDPRVNEVGFTRLSDLLNGVDAVVAAGGAGTVLGAAAAGRPMVLLPYFPDQRWHGAALEALGAGTVAQAPPEVGTVLARFLLGQDVELVPGGERAPPGPLGNLGVGSPRASTVHPTRVFDTGRPRQQVLSRRHLRDLLHPRPRVSNSQWAGASLKVAREGTPGMLHPTWVPRTY